jgi:hypothetical protein
MKKQNISGVAAGSGSGSLMSGSNSMASKKASLTDRLLKRRSSTISLNMKFREESNRQWDLSW